MTDFSPRRALESALLGWWLLVLGGLLGGLFGWIGHQFKPPIYQATVAFTTDVDFAMTGPLTEREANQVLGSAVNLLFSTRTVGIVVDAASAEGFILDAAELRSSATLERRVTLLQIHVRHADPVAAAAIANLWADIGLAELTLAADHAVEILAWNARIEALSGCSPYPAPAEETESCIFAAGGAVQDEIREAREARTAAAWGARGISPALLYSLNDRAEIPSEPTHFGRTTLIFWGAVIGMILSAGLLGMRESQMLKQVDAPKEPNDP